MPAPPTAASPTRASSLAPAALGARAASFALLVLGATILPACTSGSPGGRAPADETAPPAEPMVWPDPLPPCSPDAPPLQRGLLVGSWAPDGPLGFDQPWLDEDAFREAHARQTVARRAWRGISSGAEVVELDKLVTDRTGPAVAYLHSVSVRGLAEPAVPDAPAVLHVRHRGRLKAWWDGALVIDAPPAEGPEPAELRVPVELHGRYGSLLLKCGRGDAALGGSMDVEVRLSRPDGSPVETQAWRPMRTPGLYPEGEVRRD